MISHAMRWASLVSLLCLTGCGNGFVWDEVLDGPYRLVAIDISEDMSLCRSVDTSGTCVGGGLPDATVFQAADLPLRDRGGAGSSVDVKMREPQPPRLATSAP